MPVVNLALEFNYKSSSLISLSVFEMKTYQLIRASLSYLFHLYHSYFFKKTPLILQDHQQRPLIEFY